MSTSPPGYYSAGTDLPAYSRRTNNDSRARRRSLAPPPRLTEHVYHISDSNPWLSLRVQSNAKATDRVPSFTENQSIEGSVSIQLDREDSIQSISVHVKGTLITGSTAHDTFLQHQVVLWNKSSGDPRASPDSDSSNAPRYKLSGEHTWPYSIQLPRTVSLDFNKASENFELPHTYIGPCSIQYSIVVHVCRSAMRADSHLQTVFIYTPNTKPNPPSLLRQAAYRARCPLPGPDMDPEGWSTSRPVKMSGTLFRKLPVEAEFTLSLADPLCYTRGTVIPCNLSVSSRDPQALDVLAAPSALSIRLRRRVRYQSNKKHLDFSEVDETVGMAVWWPRGLPDSQMFTRQLEGEIRLPFDLMPSASLPRFAVSYLIEILPSEHPAFIGRNKKSDALLAEPVKIATMHARGPRPQAYAPPRYVPPKSDDDSSLLVLDAYGIGASVCSSTTIF